MDSTGIHVLHYPPPSTSRVYISALPSESPNVGELLILKFRGRKRGEEHEYNALGVVTKTYFELRERLESGHPGFLSRLGTEEGYFLSSVYLIGEIVEHNGSYRIEPLLQSPLPGKGTEVKIATREDLEKILRVPKEDHKYINIGEHIPTGVDVYVSLEDIATRHLAVLAITGAGKSNTIAHIIREIVTRGKRVLPIVVFDMHGEYDLNLGGSTYIREKPRFDPYELEAEEYYPLIGLGERAIHERTMFLEAVESAKHLASLYKELLGKKYSVRMPRGMDFVALLSGVLASIALDAAMEYSRNKERNLQRTLSVATYIARRYGGELSNPKKFSYFFSLGFIATIAKMRGSRDSIVKGDKFSVDIGITTSLDLDYSIAENLGLSELDEDAEMIFARIVQKLREPALLYKSPGEDMSRAINILRKFLAFAKKYKDYISYRDLLDERHPEALSLGGVLVLDLSGLSLEEADVLVSFYMNKLFKDAKKAFSRGERYVRALMILEEAHNFIGDRVYTRTREIAERIMREGRKYGLGLIVVSQRPRRLDTNIMSQVNNYIILKIVHPEDQSYVSSLTETLPEELSRSLSSLKTGEALLVGPFLPIGMPLFVKIKDASDFKRRGQSAEVKKRRERYSL